MRRMLVAAAFALAFHGWLFSSQCAWLISEAPTASLRRTVHISLAPAPPEPTEASADSTTAGKNEPKPKPAASPAIDAGKKPAQVEKKKPPVSKPPARKPPPTAEKAPPEAPPPEPAKKAKKVVEAPPPSPFSGLFDSVDSSQETSFIPEGIAALSRKTEAAPVKAVEDSSSSSSAVDNADALTEARPLYRQNPAPDYPRLARRRGYQGTVILAVMVEKTGRVKDVKLDKSSGHDSLDRAAKRAVKGWRFDPGRHGDDPVDMWVKVPVRFQLQ